MDNNNTQSQIRFLRLPEVQERVSLSKEQIYHLIAIGAFPKQIKLGYRACAWLEDEIASWQEERIRDSRGSDYLGTALESN